MTARRDGDPPLYFDMHVFVCTNRRADGHPKGSCAARGSDALLAYAKLRSKQLGISRIRVNAAGCLDRCEHGPCLVIYPEGIWYKVETEADIDLVLQDHVAGGGRAHGLMIGP